MAVKPVTENPGKNTPGIDGEIWNTPHLKARAIQTIGCWKNYHPCPLKRIHIPKKDKSRTRPLSIPVMGDRARQALYKMALEPIAETKADKNSYGFRLKRNCADAIDQCFKIFFSENSPTYILEGDIKGFFDNISFQWILDNIPMNKKVLSKWLSCGFMEKGKLSPTTQGVPQGGIVSPAIANMVLDRIEKLVHNGCTFRRKHHINFVRFADDFIVTASNKEVLQEVIIPLINTFLQIRGVVLSKEKTKITHINEGFDFLGQNIRKFDRCNGKPGKLQITPSKSSREAIKEKVKAIFKSSNGLSQEALIGRLSPVLRGWANYHRHIICRSTFFQLDHFVWKRIFRWARRRHGCKTKPWIARRYFSIDNEHGWLFRDKKSGKTLLWTHQDIATYRHIKIQADANPFDKQWDEYFRDRDRKLKLKSVGKFYGKVLWQQKGICPICHQILEEHEETHLHHKDGDHSNNRLVNLVLLHPNCHRQTHNTKEVTT